jgi:hypothetical protein
MFGNRKRRKEAESKLKLVEDEKMQAIKALVELQYKYDCLESEPNYIKNLPASPRRVEIQFHIGVRKVVMFDGENFIKPNGQTYRMASIKCWREV